MSQGQHVVSLDATKTFASGVYFIRVVSPKGEATYRFLKS
jgi:hypothetical protein